MSSPVYVGIDVGTSETKGVATGADGTVLAFASHSHRVRTPAPGHVEHDAEEDWWGGFVAVLRDLLGHPQVDASRVVSLCCSGIGPCVLPVDEHSIPLRPAILYGVDSRASLEVEELTQRWGAEEVRQRCGNDLTSQSAGPKVAWLARHEPDVHARARWFLTCQSFLVLRLTGRAVVDHATAAYFHPFYRLIEHRWDVSDCDDLVHLAQLPELAWSGEAAGTVLPQVAATLGLPANVVVAVGTADAVADSVASGVRGPGDLMCMYGSSGFFIAPTQQPRPSTGLYCAPGVEPGRWILAGGTSTAGAFVRWTTELLGITDAHGKPDWVALEELAAQADVGSGGVTVVPHLAGERTPFEDPNARAVIAGLAFDHERCHVARAAIEGVAVSMALGILAVLEAAEGGYTPNERRAPRVVAAVGGGTQSMIWLQTVSDLTGLTQRTVAPGVGAAYGGAMLAAAAHGSVSLEVSRDWVQPALILRPNHGRAAVLRHALKGQQDVYVAMRSVREQRAHLTADTQEVVS